MSVRIEYEIITKPMIKPILIFPYNDHKPKLKYQILINEWYIGLIFLLPLNCPLEFRIDASEQFVLDLS